MAEQLSNQEQFDKRTGNKLGRVDLTHLDKVEELIKKHCNGIYTTSYDVVRDDYQDFDDLSYTEIFKSAVYLIPAHTETAYKMAHLCVTSYRGNIEQDRQTLLERIQMCDKYTKLTPINETFSSICFLPGSNLLRQAVTLGKLAEAAYYDDKLMFKMHPLTNEADRKTLRRLIPPTRVIPPEVAGFPLLEAAERVYTTSASELGLYASLLGKTVIDITRFSGISDLSYSPLYRFLHYPYTPDDLVKVLINPMSGVIFHQEPDLEGAVKNVIDTIIELQDLNKTYSNENYIQRIRDIKCNRTKTQQDLRDTSSEQTESSKDTASQSHSQTTNESTETTQLGTN